MAATATIQPAWTLQSQNTAAVGRAHDLSFLAQGSTVPMAFARAGVLPTVATSGNTTAVDFFVLQSGTPAMTVGVSTGAAVVANSAGRGPYVCENTTAQTLTVTTANPSNPRLDLIYLQVIDTVAGDTGSSITQVGIVTGTASGSPVLPSLPTNGVCIPLAQVAVGAGVTSIVNANITDLRKSAAIGKGPRLLLAGDALTDPGFCYGELRQRQLSTYPSDGTNAIVTDYWGFDSKWHGLNNLVVTPAWQNGTSNIPLPTANTNVTLWVASIADPGWAYNYSISVNLYALVTNGGVISLQVHEVSASGTNVYNGFANSISGNNVTVSLPTWVNTTAKTGALALYIVVQSTIASSTAVFAGGATQCSVTVDPN